MPSSRRASRVSRLARCVGIVLCLLVVVLAPASARARPINRRDEEDASRSHRNHHRRREDVLVEALERQSALERALRHPENDLDVSGACGDVARRACGHVDTARALAREAKRLADAERKRKNARRGKTRETMRTTEEKDSSSSRSLLALSRGRGRGRSTTPTTSRRPTRDANADRGERDDARGREEEEEAKKRAEAIDAAKFEQLKSYPKGALRDDPNELERALRKAKAALEKNPNDANAKTRAARLEGKKRRMIDEFGKTTIDDGARRSGARSMGHDDDHWFMNDASGASGTSYRRRHGAGRVSSSTAKDNYEYLLRKIPTVSKSYFDCVGQIITRDDKAALQNFMEFSGSRAYESVASPACRREYATQKDRVASFWNAEEDVMEKCANDVAKHCDGVEVGYGLVASCLWRARDEDAAAVESTCGEALARVTFAPAATTASAEKTENGEKTEKSEMTTMPMARVESKPEPKPEPKPELTKPSSTLKKSAAAAKTTNAGGEPEKMDDDDDVGRRLREADARVKFAEEAAAHAAAQTRNLFACMTAAGVVYVVTRRGARKKFAGIARRLRRDSKGEHLG